MVGQMTYGKRQFEDLDGVMRTLIPPFHQAMNELLVMVDSDSTAFNSYMVRERTGTTGKNGENSCLASSFFIHLLSLIS